MPKHEKLFLISYAIYLVHQILSYSFYSVKISGTLSRLVLVLCLFLFLVNDFRFGKLYKNKLISYLSVVFMSCICIYLNYPNLAFMLLVIFYGRNVDFKDICRVTAIVTVIGLLFVFTSAKMGIITEYIGYRGDGTKRSYLGFRYALFAPGFLINLLSCYIYLKSGKLGKIKLIACLLFSYYIYSLTDARLSFVLAVAMIILTPIISEGQKNNSNVKKRIISKALIPIYPVLTLISVLCSLYYRSNSIIWQTIDRILTRRLQYSQRSLLLYGVKLFGNSNIKWAGFSISADGTLPVYDSSMIYVDNAYIHLLQRYGVIFTALIAISFTYTMYILYKKNDYLMQFLFVIVAIHALIDNQVLYLCFNAFLFPMYNEIVSYTKKAYIQENSAITEIMS